MNSKLIKDNIQFNTIFNNIKELVVNSRNKIYTTVNIEMLKLYWNIGKIIMEIQKGDERAKYGDSILEKLSEKLTSEFGKGFSSRNLRTMRKFYLIYPIWQTVSSKLSWSHYLELIKIEDKSKRNFYFNECINTKWSVRELQRQRDSLLYERLLLSADKEKVLELSEKGQILKTSKDLVKDPFVLEFLDIKENTYYLESDLEKNILEHLKEFLLELGKVTHQDIGQMQMYVSYYDREIKQRDENQTIGILLSTNKNETVVKYTLPQSNETIFSTEYKLHMPTEQELISAVEEEKKNFELN